MIAALPFERVSVPGSAALAEWQRLGAAKRGMPVVVGGDADLERIAEQFSLDDPVVFGAGSSKSARPVSEVLASAAALNFPADLSRWPGAYRKEDLRAPAGDWPERTERSAGLTVASDILTGRPLDRVHILLIQTDESWKIPAFLRWGDWNACPPPEYHVSALHSWSKRYGAELVGLNGDALNVRVKRRPRSRNEALGLAREMYWYCPDIVDQGTGTLAVLAKALMHDDWWFFWWD